MSDILTDIGETLDRANEHIDQLEREIETFLSEDSDRVVADFDTEAAKAFHEAQLNRPIPPSCGTPILQSQWPIFLFEPTEKDEIRRYEGQVKGITRPHVLAAIQLHQPWQRKNRRGGHWLAILKGFSNTDKHRSLVLHRMNVQPRVHVSTRWKDGTEVDADGSLDYETTPKAFWTPIDDAEVTVMNVQRRFASSIAFAQWGDTGQSVEVILRLRSVLTSK